MQTLSLATKLKFNDKLPILGKELGYGADGQVFELVGDPSKVIKISILYDNFETISLDEKYQNIYKNINNIIKNDQGIFAKVFSFTYLGRSSREFIHNETVVEQQYILYSYVMEKLQKISEDEKKVFHTVLSHEDRGIIKNYSNEKLKKILKGLWLGLDFKPAQVIMFHANLRKSKIIHCDLHPRNIMKNSLGNYLLIDFDRIKEK